MRKDLFLIFSYILIFNTIFFTACQSNRLQDNIQRNLDDMQKQIFELQQDQAYINTKVEQVAGELASLHERTDAQEKQLQEAVENQDEIDKSLKTIKEGFFKQTRQKATDEEDLSDKQASSYVDAEKQKDLFLSPRRLYEEALDLIRSDKIDPAIPLLIKYTELYPRTELADNAQYWLGECYYKKGDFPRAIQEFKKIFVNYPNGNKVPAALLKLGYAYYELKQIPQALEALQKIIKQYSDDSTYPLAQKKIDLILSER